MYKLIECIEGEFGLPRIELDNSIIPYYDFHARCTSDDETLIAALGSMVPRFGPGQRSTGSRRLADFYLISRATPPALGRIRRSTNSQALAGEFTRRYYGIDRHAATLRTARFPDIRETAHLCVASGDGVEQKVMSSCPFHYRVHGDSSRAYHVVVNTVTGTLVVTIPARRAVYVFQDDRDTLLFESYLIYNNILIRRMLSKGWVCVHAACAERDGRAVVFCGKSGRGKTTAVLHCCRGAGFRFVDNDILFLKPVGNSILVRCWDRRAGIGVGTLGSIPGLRDLVMPSDDGGKGRSMSFKYHLSRSEVEAMVESSRYSELEMALLVFPALREGAHRADFRFSGVDREAGNLLLSEGVQLRTDDDVNWFGEPSFVSPSYREALDKLMANLPRAYKVEADVSTSDLGGRLSCLCRP